MTEQGMFVHGPAGVGIQQSCFQPDDGGVLPHPAALAVQPKPLPLLCLLLPGAPLLTICSQQHKPVRMQA